MTRAIAVVIHDVAPSTLAACERVLGAVRAVAPVPVTLLAVPRYHGLGMRADFERRLDAALADGDELALHGFTHVDPGVPRDFADYALRRWYTNREGEFAGLARDEASRRLAAGRAWFAAHGWPLHGFVAPAWLMSEGAWQAVEEAGVDYTCTLTSVVAFRRRRRLASRALVFSTRSAWRRTASVGWNTAVAAAERRNPLLRLELHPDDADHPAVRRTWQRLLSGALATRRALTLHEAVRDL